MTRPTFTAFQVTKTESGFERDIVERSTEDLPEGNLLIEVQYSSLNYKDALSATGNPGVTRNFPHTPGIDAAGIILDSNTFFCGRVGGLRRSANGSSAARRAPRRGGGGPKI